MSDFTLDDIVAIQTSKDNIKANVTGLYKPKPFWEEYGNYYLKTFETSEKMRLNVQSLISRLYLCTGKSVLEVGCGFGRNLPFVKANLPQYKRVVGVEHSQPMIDSNVNYRKMIETNHEYELVQGNAKELPFADNEFDVVYTHVCLTHIPPEDIPQVTSEISSVAKNNIVHIERYNFPYEHPNPHRWSHCLPPFYLDKGWELVEYDMINEKHKTVIMLFRRK